MNMMDMKKTKVIQVITTMMYIKVKDVGHHDHPMDIT
jgi:hypothetical protein